MPKSMGLQHGDRCGIEKIELTEEQEAILNVDMEAEMQRLEPYLYEV